MMAMTTSSSMRVTPPLSRFSGISYPVASSCLQRRFRTCLLPAMMGIRSCESTAMTGSRIVRDFILIPHSSPMTRYFFRCLAGHGQPALTRSRYPGFDSRLPRSPLRSPFPSTGYRDRRSAPEVSMATPLYILLHAGSVRSAMKSNTDLPVPHPSLVFIRGTGTGSGRKGACRTHRLVRNAGMGTVSANERLSTRALTSISRNLSGPSCADSFQLPMNDVNRSQAHLQCRRVLIRSMMARIHDPIRQTWARGSRGGGASTGGVGITAERMPSIGRNGPYPFPRKRRTFVQA